MLVIVNLTADNVCSAVGFCGPRLRAVVRLLWRESRPAEPPVTSAAARAAGQAGDAAEGGERSRREHAAR